MDKIINFAKEGEISKKAEDQVKDLLENYPDYIEKVQLMPDTHYCNGEVPVGSLIFCKKGINPDWVSADIGCGVLVAKLGYIDISKFEKLDESLHKIGNRCDNDTKVGSSIFRAFLLQNLFSKDYRCLLSIDVINTFGTLGGGNHFVEISEYKGDYYAVIHTGSRALGGKVYKNYKAFSKRDYNKKFEREFVNLLKENVEHKHIQEFINLSKKVKLQSNKNVLTGQYLKDYIREVGFCNLFAHYNRIWILNVIEFVFGVNSEIISHISHNGLVDCGKNEYIVYKGAIPASENSLETTYAIPINMKDGTLIGKYLPNSESKGLPHGAGRLLSRTEAYNTVSLDNYEKSMEGIYSTTVNKNTIDEAPVVYKSIEEITEQLKDMFEITAILKPVYSFKC